MSDSFFDEPLAHSVVKSEIVYKYFKAWSTIIKSRSKGKIGYVDLYSGPGIYEDGTESTPMLVLRHAISDPALSDRIVFIFNDKDKAATDMLRKNINTLDGIDTLQHHPKTYSYEVGPDIAAKLSGLRSVPCLVFADPWGYKGLSLRLIGDALQAWGTECLIFFNYNRVNMALSHPNPSIKQNMIDLFGETRLLRLGSIVGDLRSDRREEVVVAEFADALRDVGARFAPWFRFVALSQGRELHYYLFFGTKNFSGYKIMKDIMSSASSYRTHTGVRPFEFTERDHLQLELDWGDPLEDLANELAERYAGKEVSVRQIFAEHSPATPYTMRHYKGALLILDSDDHIRVMLPGGRRRRKDSMPDDAIVCFDNCLRW